MQFILSLSAFLATATATSLPLSQRGAKSLGSVTIVNRCNYDVTLWSVHKQIGCPKATGKVLKKGGQAHTEQFSETADGGVSIKMSKYDTCGGHDITQFEYNIVENGNYLDMSFVDCQKGDCPGWHDGFYLKSGNSGRPETASAVNNEHCPIFKVSNAVEAARVSYVNPDDRQTKWCLADQDAELYLCGSQAPGENDKPVPASSAAPSSPKPTTISTQMKPATIVPLPESIISDVLVKPAAVTPAPAPPKPYVTTVITYVTVAVDAPVKRHAHGRRHQNFNA